MPHREPCTNCGRNHVPGVDCEFSKASDEMRRCEWRLQQAAMKYAHARIEGCRADECQAEYELAKAATDFENVHKQH